MNPGGYVQEPIYIFTTRTPAVPDIYVAGRINGPYVRHVV